MAEQAYDFIGEQVKKALELAERLGLTSKADIEALAMAMGDAYLEGVKQGGVVALSAIDDALSASKRVAVN